MSERPARVRAFSGVTGVRGRRRVALAEGRGQPASVDLPGEPAVALAPELPVPAVELGSQASIRMSESALGVAFTTTRQNAGSDL